MLYRLNSHKCRNLREAGLEEWAKVEAVPAVDLAWMQAPEPEATVAPTAVDQENDSMSSSGPHRITMLFKTILLFIFGRVHAFMKIWKYIYRQNISLLFFSIFRTKENNTFSTFGICFC